MNNEFWDEVAGLITPCATVDIEYRLYYNEFGDITICTQIATDNYNGQYVVVTKEQYDRYFDYRIVNGILKKIDRDPGYRVQLMTSTRGYPTVKGHAGLLLEPDEQCSNIEYYEPRNY